MSPATLDPQDHERAADELKSGSPRFASEKRTREILNNPDLMDSINRSRRARERGDHGTSLEDARKEILGENV